MHLIALSVYDNDNTLHLIADITLWCLPENEQEDDVYNSRAPPSASEVPMVPHWNRFCGTNYSNIQQWQSVHPNSERLFHEVGWGDCSSFEACTRSGWCSFQGIKNRRYSVVVHDCIGYSSVFHKHLTAFSHTIYCELQFFFYSSSCAWDYHKC